MQRIDSWRLRLGAVEEAGAVVTMPDSELVCRCRAAMRRRSARSCSGMIDRFYFLTWKMLSNDEDARDLTQETSSRPSRPGQL